MEISRSVSANVGLALYLAGVVEVISSSPSLPCLCYGSGNTQIICWSWRVDKIINMGLSYCVTPPNSLYTYLPFPCWLICFCPRTHALKIGLQLSLTVFLSLSSFLSYRRAVLWYAQLTLPARLCMCLFLCLPPHLYLHIPLMCTQSQLPPVAFPILLVLNSTLLPNSLQPSSG